MSQQSGTPADRQHELERLMATQSGTEPAKNVDISDMDLNGADLRFVKVDHLIARNAAFRRSNWTRASIQDGEFDSADFVEACLEHAAFFDCVFGSVNFTSVNAVAGSINMSSCPGCRFDHAVFTGGEITGSIFDECSFKNAKLEGIHAQSAVFRKADLSGADLSNGDFAEADFTGALLDNVNWSGARLDKAKFDPGADPRSSR